MRLSDLASDCLSGGHPPGATSMTVAAHCQKLINARSASMLAMSKNKWENVNKELDHGH